MPAAAKSPEHLAFGRALRSIREEHGISQEELGFRAGLHRNYVGSCERGEINLSLRVILKLAQALEVSFTQLARRYDAEAATPRRSP